MRNQIKNLGRVWYTLLVLVFGAPLYAQLYSYKAPNGQLVITDRLINKKGYELLNTQKPRSEEKKEESVTDRHFARSPISKGKLDPRFQLSKRQLVQLIWPTAKSMKVDPNLVYAVCMIESSGNFRAKSAKGAMGLMQLIPATAERFGVKNPWDPNQNIKGGIQYLKYLLAYFEGNVDLVLAGYNAGENAVDRHGGIPPYKETQRYVKKIRKLYKEESTHFDPKVKNRSKLVLTKKSTIPQHNKAASSGYKAAAKPN